MANLWSFLFWAQLSLSLLSEFLKNFGWAQFKGGINLSHLCDGYMPPITEQAKILRGS